MQYTMQRELGLPILPEPADVADAIACALCHYYTGHAHAPVAVAAPEGASMITRITGIVNRVLDEEVRLQVGPLRATSAGDGCRASAFATEGRAGK
jgi:hypothetical protein